MWSGHQYLEEQTLDILISFPCCVYCCIKHGWILFPWIEVTLSEQNNIWSYHQSVLLMERKSWYICVLEDFMYNDKTKTTAAKYHQSSPKSRCWSSYSPNYNTLWASWQSDTPRPGHNLICVDRICCLFLSHMMEALSGFKLSPIPKQLISVLLKKTTHPCPTNPPKVHLSSRIGLEPILNGSC